MNKPLKKSGKNGKPQNPFLIKYSLNFMLAVEIEQVVLPETDLTGFRAAAAAKSLQSCPTLCDPIDGSPPGSPIPGILQARTLEWVAISFSSAWKWRVKVKSLSHASKLNPLPIFKALSYFSVSFPGGSAVPDLPANEGDTGSIPGRQEDPLKEERATQGLRMRWLERNTDSVHVNLIKRRETVKVREPGVLQSMGSWRVGHDLATEQQPVFLPGESHGQRSLAGYSS